MDESYPLAIEHAIEPISLGEAPEFPRTYVASWSVVGFQRFPGPFDTVCKQVLPVTNATFRLHVTSARFGLYSLKLATFDRIGNYPGVNTSELEGEVALSAGDGIRINEVGGRAWTIFYGATFVGSATMEASFSAPWAARTSGKSCFSGENTFRRRFGITRVGLTDDREGSIFDSGSDSQSPA